MHDLKRTSRKQIIKKTQINIEELTWSL